MTELLLKWTPRYVGTMKKPEKFAREGWQWYLVAAAMWMLFAVLISSSDELSKFVRFHLQL